MIIYSMEFPMNIIDDNDLRQHPRPEATDFSKMVDQVLS